MNDDAKLSELLGSLPREKASPYFTVGVLRRLRDAQGRRRLQPIERFVAAAAAVVLLAAAGLGLNSWRLERERVQDRQAALARLEVLESERAALEEELAALARTARVAEPIHLTSTPGYDVVLDMTRLARRAQERSVAIPAANSSQTPTSYVPATQGEN